MKPRLGAAYGRPEPIERLSVLLGACSRSCFQSLQEELEKRVINLIAASSRANEQAFICEPSEVDAFELLTNLGSSKFLSFSCRKGAKKLRVLIGKLRQIGAEFLSFEVPEDLGPQVGRLLRKIVGRER